jgi:uncharacterized protein
MSNTVSSPCVKLCQIDPVMQICIGCGRTIREIGGWAQLDEPERRSIMAGLPERMTLAWKERARLKRAIRKGSA